jgi:hypothetical protein
LLGLECLELACVELACVELDVWLIRHCLEMEFRHYLRRPWWILDNATMLKSELLELEMFGFGMVGMGMFGIGKFGETLKLEILEEI